MNNIKLYFDLQKAVFNSELPTERPAIFKELNLPKGNYVWGVASNNDIDQQKERVITSDEVARTLENFGKIMIEHDRTGANSGLASAGTIHFSRIVPEMDKQHILLARLNEFHPLYENTLGSIHTKNLDSFSVAGYAPPTFEYNPQTGKTEKIRRVEKFYEVSLTSSPANEGSQIIGSFIVKNMGQSEFFRPLKGFGGVEIYKTKEGDKMQNDNFVPMESYQKDIGELKDLLQKIVEAGNKNVEAIKSMHENFTTMQKTLSSELEVEKAKEEPAVKNASEDAIKKEFSELKDAVNLIKKSMGSGSFGVAKEGRSDSSFNLDSSKTNKTPVFNFMMKGAGLEAN